MTRITPNRLEGLLPQPRRGGMSQNTPRFDQAEVSPNAGYATTVKGGRIAGAYRLGGPATGET